MEIYKDDDLIAVIEGENFQNTTGFSQTTYEDGNSMGGVEYVNVAGNWLPAAWNLWSVGFVKSYVALPSDGDYRFKIISWGSDFGDGVAANMTVTLSGLQLSDETAGQGH